MLIKNLYSTTNHLELKWLSSILWGGIVLMLIGSSSLLLHHLTPLEIPQYGGQYLNIAYSISIIILGYNGFRQTAVFIQPPLDLVLEKPNQRKEANAAVKYQKSRMDLRIAQSVYQKLLNHMDSAKPYIDPDLTLFKLAEQLETTVNKLSYVINSFSGYNFFEFVNKYRIDLVIEKMEITDMRQITLLGLALDCGFNSKASFNRAFKKFSGQTPSEYMKRMDVPNG
jgi:AraC-like DNA-binding protein